MAKLPFHNNAKVRKEKVDDQVHIFCINLI